MRLLMEPIDVAEQVPATALLQADHLHSSGLGVQPRAFCWQGLLYEVETVLETWSARCEWWGTEEQREYFLVLTQMGVMEIFQSKQGWILSRVFD